LLLRNSFPVNDELPDRFMRQLCINKEHETIFHVSTP